MEAEDADRYVPHLASTMRLQVRGKHYTTGVAEEEDGEEENKAGPQVQWIGNEVAQADSMTNKLMATTLGGGGGPPPPRRKALLVAPGNSSAAPNVRSEDDQILQPGVWG